MTRRALGAIVVLSLVGPAAGQVLPADVDKQGQADQWTRLRETLLDEKASYRERAEALRTACHMSDDALGQEITAIVRSWVTELNIEGLEKRGFFDDPVATAPQSPLATLSLLIPVFVEDCVPHLQAVMADQEQLLGLLKAIAADTLVSGRAQVSAIRWIVQSPAARETRQRVALEIITKKGGGVGNYEALIALMDASTLPTLRSLVRKSADTASPNFFAVHILGHLGDLEILPDLRAWRAEFGEDSGCPTQAVDFAIWQIEFQHPPSKLVEYIGSDAGWHARPWAIKRAIELGISKDEVHIAILAHAAQITSVGKKRQSALSEIKRVGLDLGVLHDDDLPDVKLPKEESTP